MKHPIFKVSKGLGRLTHINISPKFPFSFTIKTILAPVIILIAITISWEAWVQIAEIPIYLLPKPSVVVARLFGDIGYFVEQSTITIFRALSGFSLGLLVAIISATLMVHFRFIEKSLYSIAVLVKVTPIVAIAPLLVIWFGFGYLPIVLIASLITFFPVLVNALTGFKSVDSESLDFFRSLRATNKDVFLKLRVPSSLPYLFAAFRISIPLSVIGAVVGEFFGGAQGLGAVIFIAHHNLDMPTSFSAILILALTGIGLTALTSVIEKRVLFWHESVRSP